MIEIGMVFWLQRRVLVLARAKRRDPTAWIVGGLALWFGTELGVAAAAWQLFGKLGLPLELAYLLAIGSSIVAVLLFVRRLERTPVQR